MQPGQTTIFVGQWLKNLSEASDTAQQRQAREELLNYAQRRMEKLARTMFYDSLQGTFIDPGDVLQEASLKLWQSMETLRPADAQEFFRLAAAQMRRVLIDQYRRVRARSPRDHQPSTSSTEMDAASHSDLERAKVWGLEGDIAQAGMSSAGNSLDWERFHEEVARLPENLRAVVDLLWYHGLTQREASENLSIDESTVKRRWAKARIVLMGKLEDLF
ncbi:sigma-70 family RNA polymerase sigma factor [bacterium]|nr:sigma-70 family RNA polymerase sigma factor [bacterium]